MSPQKIDHGESSLVDRAEQGVEGVFVAQAQHRADRSASIVSLVGDDAGVKLAQQMGALGVVHFAKPARHVRFQGEAMQHRFAEGVDGLDLQSAGRFDRLREQATRAFQVFPSGTAARDLRKLARQIGFGHACPSRQPSMHPGRHLRRTGLGVGQAQDAGGRHAVQKEAHDAKGENEGLARARIGRHPSRSLRISGKTLQIGGSRQVAFGCGREAGRRSMDVHASPPPSSSSPSPVDHSRTRARWS